MSEYTIVRIPRRVYGRISICASRLLLSGILLVGVMGPAANAADLELKSDGIGKINKIEPKSKPKLQKVTPKPAKTKVVKPKKSTPDKTTAIKPRKLDKKIAKPSTRKTLNKQITKPAPDTLKKLDVAPKGGGVPVQIKKAAIQQPGNGTRSLKKNLLKPSNKTLVNELDLGGTSTQPLQNENSPGVVSSSATTLQVDPDSSLSKQLVAPEVKDLVIKPEIQESLGAKLDLNRESVAEGSLQGLAGEKGSTVGERAGLGKNLGAQSNLSKTINESLTGYSGPDPGGRRSGVMDRLDRVQTYRDAYGLAGGEDFQVSAGGTGVFVVVLTNSEAREEGINGDNILDYQWYDAGTDDYFGVITVPDDATQKNRETAVSEYVKYRMSDNVGVYEEQESDSTEADNTEQADSDESGSTGEEQTATDTATALQETAEGAEDAADDDDGSEASSDNENSDGSDSNDSDVADDGSSCPEGDENCNGSGDDTQSEDGGRTVDGVPGDDGTSCDEAGGCEGEDPSKRGDDGTIRTAGDQEGKGGPLKGDTDTSAADGTLRLANEEQVGGELVRGENVLQGAGDGTLRTPEGEDDDAGGTPQIAGDSGGGGIGNPGVVTEGVVSGGGVQVQQELNLQSGELNLDTESLENVGEQAGQ